MLSCPCPGGHIRLGQPPAGAILRVGLFLLAVSIPPLPTPGNSSLSVSKAKRGSTPGRRRPPGAPASLSAPLPAALAWTLAPALPRRRRRDANTGGRPILAASRLPETDRRHSSCRPSVATSLVLTDPGRHAAPAAPGGPPGVLHRAAQGCAALRVAGPAAAVQLIMGDGAVGQPIIAL